MGGCQPGLEVCLCIRIWFFDIILPLLEKAAEFIVLVYLIQGGFLIFNHLNRRLDLVQPCLDHLFRRLRFR